MSCRFCGNPATTAFRCRDRRYEECPLCLYRGLGMEHFPDPQAERERYLLHHNDVEDPGYRGFLGRFLARLPPAGSGALALDFGSGPEPALAGLLELAGWTVRAYDPYFAPGESWRRLRFDLITVHEVAEHLPYPRRSLTSLAGKLKPGGCLAIRTGFSPLEREAFCRWWYREDPTHRGFFAPETMRRAEAVLGLKLALLEEPDFALFKRAVS